MAMLTYGQNMTSRTKNAFKTLDNPSGLS